MATTPAPAKTPPGTAPAATGRPGPKPMTIALVLVLGSIMISLDVTVVNIAINRLSQNFGAPLATIQWVATGYSLALGAVMPTTAWAVGRFGARRLYLGAITAFGGASVLAGLAWNIESLIAFRVLQGLGGGLVMPLGMTILLRAAGKDQVGRLMGTLGLAILVGPLAGPVLGGWLIDEVSWRWMFFINAPITVAVVVLAARLFPRDAPGERRPLDVRGLLMLSPGIAALLYGVTTGGERGDFAAPQVLVPLAAGAALIAGFVARALTAAHPLIDLRPFRDRTFAAATATLALFATGYFGSMLLLPLYLQVVRGESATMAGLLGIPFALGSGTAMQVAGRIADRVPSGRLLPVTVGMALTGFALFAAQLSADASYWGLGATMLLMGAGGGATMMPAMTAATRGMSAEQTPTATTTVSLVSTTAQAIGMALASIVLAALLGGVIGGPARDGGGGALESVHRLDPDARAAIAESLAGAFQHTYLLAVVLVALAIVPTLLLPRRRTELEGK